MLLANIARFESGPSTYQVNHVTKAAFIKQPDRCAHVSGSIPSVSRWLYGKVKSKQRPYSRRSGFHAMISYKSPLVEKTHAPCELPEVKETSHKDHCS